MSRFDVPGGGSTLEALGHLETGGVGVQLTARENTHDSECTCRLRPLPGETCVYGVYGRRNGVLQWIDRSVAEELAFHATGAGVDWIDRFTVPRGAVRTFQDIGPCESGDPEATFTNALDEAEDPWVLLWIGRSTSGDASQNRVLNQIGNPGTRYRVNDTLPELLRLAFGHPPAIYGLQPGDEYSVGGLLRDAVGDSAARRTRSMQISWVQILRDEPVGTKACTCDVDLRECRCDGCAVCVEAHFEHDYQAMTAHLECARPLLNSIWNDWGWRKMQWP